MSVDVVTHLNFRGQARKALEFYHSVFGGHQAVVTYKDAGVPMPEGELNNVMWGQVAAPNGFRVMAYDVPSHMPWNQGENAFFVSLQSKSHDEIQTHWAGLSQGATIVQPLAPAKWAPLYGMLKDQFGVVWVVSVSVEYTPG